MNFFSEKSESVSFPPRGMKIVVGTTLVLLTVYLAVVAYRLRLEYFDNYSVLLNARAIGTANPAEFYWKRFLFLPILLSGFFWLEAHFFSEPFAFVASHFAAVGFFVLFLWVFYRMLRLSLGRAPSMAGTWLAAMNPLIIHFAPFSKEDIPATLLVTAAFYFYLKALRTRRALYFFLSSLAIPAAMTMRYNLIPLLFPVIAVYELASRNTRVSFSGWKISFHSEQFWRKFFFCFFLPLVFFCLIPGAVYSYLGRASFFGGPIQLIKEIVMIKRLNKTWEPAGLNLLYLGCALTWPLFLSAALGFVMACVRRRPGSLFHALWFLIFFVFQSFVIANKEARYLFVLYPPLYFFLVCGVEEIGQWVSKITFSKKGYRIVFFLFAAALFLFMPVKNALTECLRFRDPMYTCDFAGKVGLYAKKVAGKHDVFWSGHYYPLHPKEFVFIPEDKYTYLYHMFNHTIRFYSGKDVRVFTAEKGELALQLAVPWERGKPVFMMKAIGQRVRDGDVLILNMEEEGYATNTVPPVLRPLVVQRVRKWEFALEAVNAQEGLLLYRSRQLSDSKIVVIHSPEGLQMLGAGIPDNAYHVYGSIANQKTLYPLKYIQTRLGTFRFTEKEITVPLTFSGLTLLFFDSVREFDMDICYE